MTSTFIRWIPLLLVVGFLPGFEGWKPGPRPIATRWAAEVTPEKVLPEYPRPQMVRKDWINLNGLWEFAEAKEGEAPPLGKTLGRRILVPFPVESSLSGVTRAMERVWYRRTFRADTWLKEKKRILLHFGGVDWEAAVWVNGKRVGTHQGGYDPFTLEVTEALRPQGDQELVVGVFDPTDAGPQPRGKQVRAPKGIWYTSCTGIWRTVWLEAVPAEGYIQDLRITPDVDRGLVEVRVETEGPGGPFTLRGEVGGPGRVSDGSVTGGDTLWLPVPQARLWSPEDPFLYDLAVELRKGDKIVDRVTSYFGMRKVSVGKDENGVTRILLNHRPYFLCGPLDQGFWPEGIYTAPTDEALRYDIEVTRRLGFNMARKHVKVEPERWYYWADRLGLLVWQDMPSGNNRTSKDEPVGAGAAGKIFEGELERVIRAYGNHPSIMMWVVFNEGWGQYDTERLTAKVKALDPTRLVNCASGWTDKGVGDVHDVHAYPGPACPEPEEGRAAVLGEFGGLGLVMPGHTWRAEGSWGYRTMKNGTELTDRCAALFEQVGRLAAYPGLSAAVYTQTTDVEIEVNGLMTYDRAEIKPEVERFARAVQALYGPLPKVEVLVPPSLKQGYPWRYTFEDPGEGWYEEGFDDKAWEHGQGGFGTEGTPGARVRTEWKGSEIWLRRSVVLPDRELHEPSLLIHHDEDAEVYVNGARVLAAKGFTTSYVIAPIAPEARGVLRPGTNLLAVHCRQTGGGQYVDVGIVDVVRPPPAAVAPEKKP